MKWKLISLLSICLVIPAILPTSASTHFSLFANKPHSKPDFLPATDAFAFSHMQQAGQLNVFWKIADGYYLYKDKVRIMINDKPYQAQDIPPGTDYQDGYFGQVKIIKQQLILSLPLATLAPASSIKIQYQGCAIAGLCYPPMTQSITTAAEK
ncbi:MAG: thiol:disulfide interchange protein [Moritella sp.]|jgi:thiol:disulfide interchange protein